MGGKVLAGDWKKGTSVWLVRKSAGKASREVVKVARVTQRGVYLETTGAEPWGPFNALSGRRIGHLVGGCTQTIERIAEGTVAVKVAEMEADFINV